MVPQMAPRRKASPAVLALSWGEQADQLCCPHCGDEYVHFDPSVEHVTDGYTCPTDERGSWIDIPMWCESGHHWNIVIAFHKGFTFLHVVLGYPVTATLPLRERQ